MRKEIFGKNISIEISNELKSRSIEEYFKLYPESSSNASSDVLITLLERIDLNSGDIAPASHVTFDKGFLADYGGCRVMFVSDDILNIQVEINDTDFLRKCLSPDFKGNWEIFGTLFHELVLIPMVGFFEDLAFIHASAFFDEKLNRACLLGGTGGVGKTSMELKYCIEKGMYFLADDIAVVDADGKVYPNYSYPKIYGYNTVGNRSLRKKILSGEGLFSKIHWQLMSRLRGLNKVRKPISPDKLFDKVMRFPQKLTDYIFLSKSYDHDGTVVRELDVEHAILSTNNIIKTEYSTFSFHLLWHEFHCVNKGINPILTWEKFYADQNRVLKSAFKEVSIRSFAYPSKLDHKDFLNLEVLDV